MLSTTKVVYITKLKLFFFVRGPPFYLIFKLLVEAFLKTYTFLILKYISGK
jgi:hypothetical protein